MHVLYVSSEVYPQLKTGGLADVNAALPPALVRLGGDVRLLLPGFHPIIAALTEGEPVANLNSGFSPPASLVRGKLNGLTAYLIIAPEMYARAGNPYLGPDGKDWPDNHLRFALL